MLRIRTRVRKKSKRLDAREKERRMERNYGD
jgi:hypothetical protein